MGGLGVLIHAKTQNSSLHFAVRSGNKHLVLYILKEMKRCSLFYDSAEDSPCDINRRNAKGAPPLEYAGIYMYIYIISKSNHWKVLRQASQVTEVYIILAGGLKSYYIGNQ